MGYFKTIHEKNSAKITGLITVILLLLLFVVGMQYLDPPEEYGVAVNFGTTDFGNGNKPMAQPVKSEVKDVTEKIEPQEEVQPEKSSTVSEELVTQQTEESIAIKKQKEAEAKAKAEQERIEREKKEAEEKKKKEEQDKKDKLDNLIGGVKNSTSNDQGGEGSDNESGNKGELDGDPYAPSYFGGSGPGKGGVGYGLNGRGRPTKKIFEQDCNEFGLVVVRIEVNNQGKVISAEPGVRGTTNTHPCLLAPAKKIALSHKWPADSKAPARQIGFVSINFDVGQ
ncbi:energy transducer TonB [Ichthyenterobacterium sp. W332]|uniref:Energy transducer TonB n=1 Tax=Microcosmobacter mediterraneus TaxID=3075607 RepID=A0ABU2YNJ3_9FLAO|nr:energy transducer TonB [Ichthyenterobacterium sp. W332]MDT0559397.1 energy transducer TonB [Ichthyenterobacterium sp. W332]